MLFEHLFGVDFASFFDEAWERCLSFSSTDFEFSELSRPIPEWSPTLLEKIVMEGDLIMMKESQYLKQSFFIDNGKANLQKIYFLWEEGFTFYARNLAVIVPEIKELTKTLESELYPMKIESNIFLTPTGQVGFLPHFDCHDVFVIQLAGKKNWKFWPALKQDMDYESPTEADQATVDQTVGSNTPVLERLLSKGDVLYMPRGAIHGPQSVSFSSHLTFWLKSPLAEIVMPHSEQEFRIEDYEKYYF